MSNNLNRVFITTSQTSGGSEDRGIVEFMHSNFVSKNLIISGTGQVIDASAQNPGDSIIGETILNHSSIENG